MKLRILAAALTASLALMACSGSDDFVNEYESLNGQETSGGSTYLELNIREDHRFTIATEEQVRDLLDKGNGAIYFGFPECPWCRNAVPVIDEAAEAVNLDEILYLNVMEMRDQKSRDADGEIVTDKEGTDFYYYLLEQLGDLAPAYTSLEDPNERRILVPLVAVVVGGNVVDTHLSTVDSQEDPYTPLTDEQHTELLDIYKQMFSRIPGCGEYACE